MKRYLSNPELKFSSILVLILMIAALLATLFIQRLYYIDLKNDYIKSLGAVTERIIEVNPNLEKEIVPLIVKGVSDEYVQKGETVLGQYGLTSNLENSLFPYYNTTLIKNTYTLLILFAGMLLTLLLLNYFQYGVLYERIRALTLASKKVIEGECDTVVNENKEGDFSKLVLAFNEMRKTIKSNISELQKEKNFLINILSDISHQLKTPLASLIVYNDIMMNKELSREQQKTFLSNTHNQLFRMQSLVYNILKLAKLDAKALKIEKEDESLNDTIQEAIDALENKAGEAMVQISLSYSEEVIFKHDKLWLQEALINIIKNAIEHSYRQGRINIELIENPIYIRIIIEDNGTGIGEDDLPNIFKRFYKASNSRKNDSVGIGLALSKSIIEAHSGIIEVQSKLNKGTKFIITFLKY